MQENAAIAITDFSQKKVCEHSSDIIEILQNDFGTVIMKKITYQVNKKSQPKKRREEQCLVRTNEEIAKIHD